MRTEAEIRARIAEIEADDRFKRPPALVRVNAPVALIQTGLKSEHAALVWLLDGGDISEGCFRDYQKGLRESFNDIAREAGMVEEFRRREFKSARELVACLAREWLTRGFPPSVVQACQKEGAQ